MFSINDPYAWSKLLPSTVITSTVGGFLLMLFLTSCSPPSTIKTQNIVFDGHECSKQIRVDDSQLGLFLNKNEDGSTRGFSFNFKPSTSKATTVSFDCETIANTVTKDEKEDLEQKEIELAEKEADLILKEKQLAAEQLQADITAILYDLQENVVDEPSDWHFQFESIPKP